MIYAVPDTATRQAYTPYEAHTSGLAEKIRDAIAAVAEFPGGLDTLFLGFERVVAEEPMFTPAARSAAFAMIYIQQAAIDTEAAR